MDIHGEAWISMVNFPRNVGQCIVFDNIPRPSVHAEADPGDPLEEDDADPGRHVVGVRLAVVVVENHDGGHHARRHHEHYAVEVSPWWKEEGQPVDN